MKIVRLEAWPVEMGLAEPYEIAYQRFDRVTNVFVRLVTDGLTCGLGCAAPEPALTGETPAGVQEILGTIAAELVKDAEAARPALLLERLRAPLASHPSALAAIDMALHDLVAKRAELPLWSLLGGLRDHIPTSITVGILPLDETVERARSRVAEGFRSLKLKGGGDVEEDAARVLAVRAAVGPAVELRFDANQGYSFEEARRFVNAVRHAQLEVLEQPTPRGEPDLLGRVTASVALPVMADESIMGLLDAFRLAGAGAADMFNVKLMKTGGLAPAQRIVALARVADMEVMVGCMDEAALGISAGLALALGQPGVTYADLDGHLDLIGDPTAAAVRLKDGTLYPSPLPGLGVELN